MDHTALFCTIDDFCKVFEPVYHQWLKESGHVKRIKPAKICLSEILWIAVLFPQSAIKCFKRFYFAMQQYWDRTLLRHWLSYSQVNALIHQHQIALASLCQFLNQQARLTDVYVIDSTPLSVCKNKRINRHKTFAHLAKRGKSSTGWFYGFKLHALINQDGEIASIAISAGNVDDRRKATDLVADIVLQEGDGELIVVGDRGYISKQLAATFLEQGIVLLTRSRKNMPDQSRDDDQEHWLSQRGKVETVFGLLKNHLGLEHSRHRSFKGLMCHVLAVVISYAFRTNKPALTPFNP